MAVRPLRVKEGDLFIYLLRTLSPSHGDDAGRGERILFNMPLALTANDRGGIRGRHPPMSFGVEVAESRCNRRGQSWSAMVCVVGHEQ